MRNTYQIRKYLAMTITVALCAGMLAGCAKSDKSAQDAAAGTGNTGTNASGNVVAGAGSTSGNDTVSSEQKEQTVQAETQKQTGTAEGAVQAGSSQNAQSVSGTTTQTQQTGAQTQQAGTQPSQAGSEATQKTPDDSDDELITGDKKDFTGTFEKSDGTEKVTITLVNDKKLTFVFRTSMINGSAKVTGSKALYVGDDDYSITFDVAGDTLIVTVDGEDAQQSSMNGVYFRDLGDDETEDEEEDDYFDADETEEYYDDEDMTDMDDEDDVE